MKFEIRPFRDEKTIEMERWLNIILDSLHKLKHIRVSGTKEDIKTIYIRLYYLTRTSAHKAHMSRRKNIITLKLVEQGEGRQ